MEARYWFSRRREGQVLTIISFGDYETWEEIREHLVPPAVRENLQLASVWASVKDHCARIVANPTDYQLRGELIEDLKQVLLRFYPGRDWGQLRGEEQRQQRNFIWFLSVVALTFLMLFLVANYQRLVALSRESAAKAETLFALGKRGEALGTAVCAFATKHTPEARQAIAHSFPQQLTKLEGHSDVIRSAAFSPDCADTTARVWNAASGQVLAKPEGHEGPVTSAAFSPDGQRVATASWDYTAWVWNTSGGGQVIAKLEGHSGGVSAAFSPDGQRVVTASFDHTARVWNAATGEVIAKPEGHSGSVFSGVRSVNTAVFSPDGQRIVTTGSDGIALIFKIVTLDEIDRVLASK